MIPKKIHTIWLHDTLEIPELVKDCYSTHFLDGYEHNYITLKDCYRNKYVTECINAGKYAKAADYLRIYYLVTEGGIYLDADVEMLPGKNFDAFLENALFACREKNNFVSNAIIGAEAGHPILTEYLRLVDENFIGSGELVYQPGMYLWTELLSYNPKGPVTIYDPEFFLPYNWQDDTMQKTENTVCIHHYNRSWIAPQQ